MGRESVSTVAVAVAAAEATRADAGSGPEAGQAIVSGRESNRAALVVEDSPRSGRRSASGAIVNLGSMQRIALRLEGPCSLGESSLGSFVPYTKNK